MSSLIKYMRERVGQQYGRPAGIVGRMIGERMRRQHEPEVQWTLSLLDVQPTDSVLEIGFGAGRGIELLAIQASQGQVMGIDLSQTMLASATRRNAHAIHAGRVDLRQGNVTTLPFNDAQFDKVMSVHTLYFWPDYAQAIAEIARVLKPRGIVALTFSPGTTAPDGTKQIHTFQHIVEEQVLPATRQAEFSDVYLKDGPNSRHYLTTTIVGTR